jgi:hypothetical protein
MHATRKGFVLLLLMAMLAACSRSRQEGARPRNAETSLRVDNRSFSDHTIYVLRSGQRIRLGLATGLQSTSFLIPRNLIFGATALRFLADPIGGNRAPVSQEITVLPGDEVGLIIQP